MSIHRDTGKIIFTDGAHITPALQPDGIFRWIVVEFDGGNYYDGLNINTPPTSGKSKKELLMTAKEAMAAIVTERKRRETKWKLYI